MLDSAIEVDQHAEDHPQLRRHSGAPRRWVRSLANHDLHGHDDPDDVQVLGVHDPDLIRTCTTSQA